MIKRGTKRGSYVTGTFHVQILTKPEIPGRWIYTNCTVCSSPLQYWSLTGTPRPDRTDARCDKHSKGGKN